MKRPLLFIFLLIALSFSSCKSSKNKPVKKPSRQTTHVETSKQARSIIDHAKKFKGVKYKYGGTSKKGMDCSGLVYTSFKANAITLPRTTSDLSKTGDWVDLKKVAPGDLVFFATRKNSRKVNHVGIVTYARPGHVEFIHASTSKGVIVSSLAEKYWYFAFVQARRIL